MDEELLLIDLLHGVYYSARRGTGPLVSDLLHGHDTPEIEARWSKRLGPPPEGLSLRLAELRDGLVEQGLALSDGQPPLQPGPEVSRSSELPELERYEDMKEIFEMDPIHDGDLERGWPVKP